MEDIEKVSEDQHLENVMQEIDEVLESIIRNSGWREVGGGTIDDLVKYAKKQSYQWKLHHMASVVVILSGALNNQDKLIDALFDMSEKLERKIKSSSHKVAKLKKQNENQESQINTLIETNSILGESLANCTKDITHFKNFIEKYQHNKTRNINSQKTFRSIIQNIDPDKLLPILHQHIDGKGGKDVGIVMGATLYKYHYITRYPTEAEFTQEFTDITTKWRAIKNAFKEPHENGRDAFSIDIRSIELKIIE